MFENRKMSSMKNIRNRNVILIALLAVLAFGGLIWVAKPAPKNGGLANAGPSAGSALAADETAFDFGSISMAAGRVRHEFRIRNTAGEPITIEKIYTSCMCTEASLITSEQTFGPYGMPGHGFIPKLGKNLGAGEEAIVEVVFDPAAHGPAGVGKVERAVAIENSGQEPLELRFSAQVTP